MLLDDIIPDLVPDLVPDLGYILGGIIYPPVLDKLLVWAEGGLQDGNSVVFDENETFDEDVPFGLYRRDYYKVPGDFPLKIELNGDIVGSEWDTVNATYVIPAEYTVALAADALEGPFLNVPRTQAEIEAYVGGKASIFFCTERGLKLYNTVLEGQELIEAISDCLIGCDVLVDGEGQPLTDDDGNVLVECN